MTDSLASHELELFRVQSEKNFFNENHFTNQNRAQLSENRGQQVNRTNTLNKYMIRSKSLSSEEDDEDYDEDENEDDVSSDSSSDSTSEQNIVPCCRIKLDTNDQNIIKINTNSVNSNKKFSLNNTDSHNNNNNSNKIISTNTNQNLNSNTASLTTNNNIDSQSNIDKSSKKSQSITIVEKKPETKFRITLRKNSDNLDIITVISIL